MTRTQILSETAELINNIKLPHPVRIGIDGIGASGKTYFADELVLPLESMGRNVIRIALDGFHNPPEIRRRQGEYSATGYLEDSFNYSAVVDNVLKPLGPNGNGIYTSSMHSLYDDKSTDISIYKADNNSILLFEGVLLLNEHLFNYFDYTIFIDTSFDITFERAKVRDLPRLGSLERLEKLYNERYIPGQKLYLKKFQPNIKADLVINNDNYISPFIKRISNRFLPARSRLTNNS